MNQAGTAKQAGKFAIVGILNTAVDFAVLNILFFLGLTASFAVFNQKFLTANVISVAVAMINSFILNKQWTFGSTERAIYAEIFKFLIITVIGMFVIHQLIFNFLYYRFNTLTDAAVAIFHFFKLNGIFSEQFVSLNFAKVIAVVGSFIWNFLGYKFVVFKK